jgi:predicted 2-oxoglutarate/Fe(II)-dependent dioxygenase YbiX
MDYLEAIMHLKKIARPSFIEKLIPYIDKKAVKNLTIEKNKKDKNIRNVIGYTLFFEDPVENLYWNYVKKEIESLLINYGSKFPYMKSNRINQIDLLKYEVGCKYETHIDSAFGERVLSFIINLNEDYEGGELVFTDQKKKEIKEIKLYAGSVVFFPSNFLYPHKIRPITKGTRYSIVGWVTANYR